MSEEKNEELDNATLEEMPVVRPLPQIIEIYGSGRDVHTRHLRRSARFQRKSFRLGGTFLIRPGRSFDMTLHVAKKHGEEIVKCVAEGTVAVRKHGKAFSLDEVRGGLLDPTPEWEVLLRELVEISVAMESGPTPEQYSEARNKYLALSGEELVEAMAHLRTQVADAKMALEAFKAKEASTDEAPSASENEPDAAAGGEPDAPQVAEEEAGAEETEGEALEPVEEPVDEPAAEPVEALEPETKPQLVPGELRLPDGYDNLKKDDLFDLFAEREDYALALPEAKTEGKLPTNSQLVEALTTWAENVVFED